MVKGGIFNALGSKIDGADVLDLFAGSGALAIEAISRGAKFSYLVDHSSEAKEVILTNFNNLKIKNYQILAIDYLKAIDILCKQKISIDILFLDPPYEMGDYENIITQCEPLLKQDAVIVVESEHPFQINGHYSKIKEYKYGRTRVTLLWK